MTTDEAASTAGPLPFDTSKAHQARMYEGWRPEPGGTSEAGESRVWGAVGRKR